MCHQKGYKNIFRLYIIDDGLGASNLLWSPSIGVFGFSSLPLHAGVVLGAAGRLRPVDALEQVLYRYYGTGSMVQVLWYRYYSTGIMVQILWYRYYAYMVWAQLYRCQGMRIRGRISWYGMKIQEVFPGTV